MSSVLDYLLSGPSLAEQYQQVSRLKGPNTLGVMSGGGSSYSGAPADTDVGVLQPGSNLLDSFKGVTLQGEALQSLIDIARQSNILPGAREMRFITDSYRSPAQQAAAYANKPGLAAPPGSSYHQSGLAVDAGWWSDYPELVRALQAAGWNRFSPSGEPWHWSYGITG